MEKARKKYRYIFQDMSIRKKIFFGYLAIIGIVLLCVIALFAVLWEKLNKDSISKSIYSSNYQIVKSIDNYFDSVIKLSEFPYLDSEIMDILRKDYQGISEERKNDRTDPRCKCDQSENLQACILYAQSN